MSKIDEYCVVLRDLDEWEPYLRAHSNLPGPRGNLELAHAVAREGREDQFLRWSALTPEAAPENTPEVFVAFCGALGLGALLRRSSLRSGGVSSPVDAISGQLRALAADPRWRVREAVATGLQLWGDADMPGLLAEMREWAAGNCYEQRAAAAAVCEPRLLLNPVAVAATLQLLDQITQRLVAVPPVNRKSGSFRVLRQALGYCWSVAVAADPALGVPIFERRLLHPDLDVRWIMRENLGKKRIAALGSQFPSSGGPAA